MGTRSNPNTGFQVLEHTADAGVKAWGPDRESLFEATAQGMYALALTEAVREGHHHMNFHIEGGRDEELLVHYLQELLFILDTRGLAATDLRLHFPAGGGMDVEGDFARIESGVRQREIKSPTYHQLKVRQQDGEWATEIYFDL